jgi:hypothetical protein
MWKLKYGVGWLGLSCLGLCWWAGSGCQTASPTGAPVMAFLQVEGHSVSEIRVAALQVFPTNGYQVKSAFGRDLVFERQASNLSSVTFGSWANPVVWLRIKLHIEELRAGVYILECNIYRVQNRGDNILEEESRAYEKSKKALRELLLQVKAKLEEKPGTREPSSPSGP